MGRLSIYLPNELEARAKALQPDTPTSQVVRAALERYIGNADEPAYAQAPDDVSDLLAAGVEHFKALATADYQEGYRAALKRLPDLDWFALAEFAKEGFDLHKWIRGRVDGIQFLLSQNMSLDQARPEWFAKITDDLGSIADPIGFDHWSFRRTPPFERGYADGLRAGYEAALAAGVMAPAAAPAPTVEPMPDVDVANETGEEAERETP
jgi:hypothetical protein